LSFDSFALAFALTNGIVIGGFFALASVGLSLIFGVQRILNVAQGSFIVLASFVTIQFSLLVTPILHLDPLVSIGLDFLVVGAVGAASYFLLIYRIENSGFQAPLLATFGLSIFIEYVIANGLRFGSLSVVPILDPSFGNGAEAQNQIYSSTSINFFSIPIPESWLIAFFIAIVVIPLLHLFLTRTYYGRAIRATAQDWQAAEFSGIDVRVTRTISFVLGSALAGVAGGILAFTNSVTPSLADTYLLPIILTVIILGGVGSMFGTLVGGIVVGVIVFIGNYLSLGVLGQYNLGGDFGYLIAFLTFLVVLMVKPSGLFGISLRK
jgi:branched-chain amino acid transport system permease protein